MTEYLDRIQFAKQPTRFDKFLFRLSPKMASGRIKARVDHELRMMLSDRAAENFAAYDGADTGRLQGDKWLTSKLSGNDQLHAELETLVDRSLDLFRNDCYAASAVNGRVDNVVGAGIRPQSRVQAKRGVITQSQADAFNTDVEKAWAEFAEADAFYEKQRMLERCSGIFGENWLLMTNDDMRYKPVTLSTQVVAPQRIAYESIGPTRSGERRRLGLRLDAKGNPTDAFVRQSVPNDSQSVGQKETEISLDDILHGFEKQFPGQLRGVPWMTPAMARLKDLKDFVHANLVAEQVAACHSAFITGITDPMMLAEAGRTRSNLEDLAPGSIQYLAEGEGVVFSDPARPGTTLAPYVEWALHGVAAALRYPYELLAKQFTNNFSGGRLALIDGRITFKVWQQCMIQRTLKKVWARFIDQCVVQGVVSVDIVAYEANRAHFLQHAWIPPGWPWVDPEKEVKADLAAIAGGLQTETESLTQRGRDFDETLANRERETMAKMESEARIKKRREELGLTPVVQEPQQQEQPEAEEADAVN